MYGFTTTLTGATFDQGLVRTIAALKAEGFGVLSDIDVQHAMEEKLGVDIPPYRILGACNPPLAHQALQAVADIGLLLPCDVIVRAESRGHAVVGFLDPPDHGAPGRQVRGQSRGRRGRAAAATRLRKPWGQHERAARITLTGREGLEIVKLLNRRLVMATLALANALFLSPAWAAGPSVTIDYQPMVSTGLAAKQPFEAWVVFDRSADPAVPGYAVPAGAVMRLKFPKEFTPSIAPSHLEGALLYGWPQGAVPVPFTVTQDGPDPRVVVVRINQAIPVGPPERPGLKAIHVRTGELNPAAAGDYPITVQLINAGSLSGTFSAVARITNQPVPTVAAINQLHQGKNEDWQHVKPGAETALPIDFLVTLPDVPRSSITVTPTADGVLGIWSDGKPIGLIRTQGVPIELRPEAFGPGYSRLGIFRIRAKAGIQSGTAEIIASLDGGTQYKITLVVE